MATNAVSFTGISLPNITVFSVKGTFPWFNGFLWFSFQVGVPNYTWSVYIVMWNHQIKANTMQQQNRTTFLGL